MEEENQAELAEMGLRCTPGPWTLDLTARYMFESQSGCVWINGLGIEHIARVDGPPTPEKISNAKLLVGSLKMFRLLWRLQLFLVSAYPNSAVAAMFIQEIKTLLTEIRSETL